MYAFMECAEILDDGDEPEDDSLPQDNHEE